MKTLTSVRELNDDSGKIYLTIGNFDGVHLGHSAFIKRIVEDAEAHDAKSMIITFVPHPALILRPNQYSLISSYEDRRVLIENLGVDYLVEMEFSRDLSTIGPREFLEDHVLNSGKVEKIFLGNDFAFGQNKSGDHDFMINYCHDHGIALEIFDKFEIDHQRVSSSLIRSCIANGNVDKCIKFLGRSYSIVGSVVKGKGRGRELGYCTANLNYPNDLIIPKNGVYITNTEYLGHTYRSITNVGNNPTFGDVAVPLIETHLLDFNKFIYGENIKVSFLKYIRPETKFNGRDELIAQLKSDAESARCYA